MEKEELIKILSNYQAKTDSASLKEIMEVTPVIDLAEALEEIDDIKVVVRVLRAFGSELSADVFTELSLEKQEKIINLFTDKELVALLEESFADDIVDSIEEFPASIVSRILNVAPKDLRKDINLLLNFKENTAGSVMTTEYISVNSSCTVKQTLETIKKNGKKAETIYTIFVRDEKRNFVGTLDLEDLIYADSDEILVNIMNKDFVCCHANDDQEKVATDFKKYDLNAMAVLNNEEKLMGIITIDDIVDVLVEEANEDIARLNKINDMETPYLETPIHKLVLKCVPWIIALMILQLFSTMILSSFQAIIAQVAVLSVFTPLLMDAGGNSGGQTTTIIVRSIAMGEFTRKDIKKVIWKEFRVAVCIAAIVSVFAFCWIMFEVAVGIVKFEPVVIDGKTYNWTMSGKALIACLVACTLFITMIVSRIVGCLLPFGAKLIKQDPAVLCGPITTTIVDIVTLLTYFLFWTAVFMPILSKIAGV